LETIEIIVLATAVAALTRLDAICVMLFGPRP
jgi:hypothetical protein